MVETRPSIATVFSTIALIAALVGTSLVVFNISSTQPMAPYAFMIYKDPVVAGQYDAKASNGTICWSSSNQTAVLANITLSAKIFDSVHITAGIVGSGASNCIIGNATALFTAGQIVYSPSIGFYALASANANTTVGYGYDWLNIINCSANANCLLMEHGSLTLASYSFTAGVSQWIGTTVGSIIDLDAAKALTTGKQLCQIGIAQNATCLKFDNPNSDYGEHV